MHGPIWAIPAFEVARLFISGVRRYFTDTGTGAATVWLS